MKNSLLLAGALTLVTAAFAQSGPATNRPAPPVPPRTDAPGTPINPQQNTVAGPAAPATEPVATPAPGAANATTPAAEPAPAPRAPRELVFAEADADKDGRVSLHEYTTFVEWRMESKSTENVREETIQRFLDLDQNNDAHLSESEASTPPAPAMQQQVSPPPRARR